MTANWLSKAASAAMLGVCAAALSWSAPAAAQSEEAPAQAAAEASDPRLDTFYDLLDRATEAYWNEDDAEAERLFDEAFALAQSMDDPTLQGEALVGKAGLYYEDDSDAYTALVEQGAELMIEGGAYESAGRWFDELSRDALWSGDLETAAAYAERCVAMMSENAPGPSACHSALANVYIDQGEPEKAVAVYLDAAAGLEGAARTELLRQAGWYALDGGLDEQLREILMEIDSGFDGGADLTFDTLETFANEMSSWADAIGEDAMAEKYRAIAEEQLIKNLAALADEEDPVTRAYAIENAWFIYGETGSEDVRRQIYEAGVEAFEAIEDPYELGYFSSVMESMAEAFGDTEAASDYRARGQEARIKSLEQTLDGARADGLLHEHAYTMIELFELYGELGDEAAQQALYSEAQGLFARGRDTGDESSYVWVVADMAKALGDEENLKIYEAAQKAEEERWGRAAQLQQFEFQASGLGPFDFEAQPDPADAREALDAMQAAAILEDDPLMQAHALYLLGAMAERDGDMDAACGHWAGFMEQAGKTFPASLPAWRAQFERAGCDMGGAE